MATHTDALRANWRTRLTGHKYALMFSIIVGLIYLAPYIVLPMMLGADYHGLPAMQTPNEDFYLARMQEIIDGHWTLGSPFFYEYKDQIPLSPPVGEMFYALPAMLLHLPAKDIMVASRFLLPLILFLLAHLLLYGLTVGEDSLARKINAIAGALFITLGYDLIDYRNLWQLITGQTDVGGFLLWARPVNPILGAIFLFSFLILILRMVRRAGRRATNIAGASVFLALMMGSYFFSWGMALSVLAALILIYLVQKEFQTAKDLAYVLPAAALLASPYWYASWQATSSPWYAASVLRSGLFLTHYPLWNKLMLLVGALFVAATLFSIYRHSGKLVALRARVTEYLQEWHWFCLALILGSLWAFSQQLVTGRTIWPYHFVQYSIPFAIIVAMTVFYNIMRRESVIFWRVGVAVIISVSIFYGVYIQTSAYRYGYDNNAHSQVYASLFDWLNSQKKDCVVITREDGPEANALNTLIPAFSHCNIYSTAGAFSLMSYERSLHNYMVLLRLKGVPADDITGYLQKNRGEAAGYLYSNWRGLFHLSDFPDFPDQLLEKRLARFPADYTQFMARDLRTELQSYRLDYILSINPMPQRLLDALGGVDPVFRSNDIFLYPLK